MFEYRVWERNQSTNVTLCHQVTSWQEVSSSATFHSKIRNKSLAIVAYGPSVPGKLTAPVLLVKSFDELAKKASEVWIVVKIGFLATCRLIGKISNLFRPWGKLWSTIKNARIIRHVFNIETTELRGQLNMEPWPHSLAVLLPSPSTILTLALWFVKSIWQNVARLRC